MEQMSNAILQKDFDSFAKITMADSNQFHAVALDTEPPIFYMNDVSRAIIAIIVEYNRLSIANGTGYKAAYTYDAGPNAVIYALDKDIKEIISLIAAYFPQQGGTFVDKLGAFGGGSVDLVKAASIPTGFNEAVAKRAEVGAVKSLIHTRVGDGPRNLGPEDSLLNEQGVPTTLL